MKESELSKFHPFLIFDVDNGSEVPCRTYVKSCNCGNTEVSCFVYIKSQVIDEQRGMYPTARIGEISSTQWDIF